MKRALFIIANNYRGNRAVRELNVGRDMVGLGGFFQFVARYDLVEIVQDVTPLEVLTALRALAARLERQDILVIYFGGHGLQRRGGEHLLVLPPAKNDPLSPAIDFLSVQELQDTVEGKGLTVGMILDCCRNDDTRQNPYDHTFPQPVDDAVNQFHKYRETQGLQVPAAGVARRDLHAGPVRNPNAGFPGAFSIFCACSQFEIAPELPGSGQGLFSTALIDVLRSAHDMESSVRLDDDLRAMVERRMRELAANHALPFSPQPWKAGTGTPELLRGVPFEWIHIPAGEYTEGSTAEDVRKNISNVNIVEEGKEKFIRDQIIPLKATLVPEFWIMKYPVTNKQYRRNVAGQERHPAVNVTWQDARHFAWGMNCALPTAAQWEKAARGPTGGDRQRPNTRLYPWGSEFNPDFCVCNVNANAPEEVGKHPAGDSPYGVSDMAGNVCDWIDAARDTSKGCKGGDFDQWIALYGMISKTEWVEDGQASSLVGFRLVSTVDPRTLPKGTHDVLPPRS